MLYTVSEFQAIYGNLNLNWPDWLTHVNVELIDEQHNDVKVYCDEVLCSSFNIAKFATGWRCDGKSVGITCYSMDLSRPYSPDIYNVKVVSYYTSGVKYRKGKHTSKRIHPNGQIHKKTWANSSGQFHRKNDKPARIKWDEKGNIIEKIWDKCGLRHREDGPAQIVWDKDTLLIKKEGWYKNGEKHREGGPAIIKYHNGEIVHQEWWYNNVQQEHLLTKKAERSLPITV
tara:strand:+ start:11749 stop:12435 length:687 start_codon:yes stop_codon:yes gene_type:complete